MEVTLDIIAFESASVRTVMLETLWQSVEAGGEVPGRKGEEGVTVPGRDLINIVFATT